MKPIPAEEQSGSPRLASVEEWLRKNAPGYNNLEPEDREALNDFVALWSVFEARVMDCNATAGRMLDAIKRWNVDNLLSDDDCAAAWSYFVARYTTDGKVSHHFKGLRLQSAAHRELLQAALLEEPPGPNIEIRHKAIALIVHRIRNNLLHGEKWSYGLADQRENFRHAGHMLMLWTDLGRAAEQV